jgi:hypothetical protein
VAAGVRARTYPSGLITLQTPNAAGRFVKLGDSYGLNDAGRHYFAAVGEEEPTAGLDMSQQPVRRQNSEFVRDRQGRMVLVRTLLPDGDFRYTVQGRKFFSRRQVEHVLGIPVIIRGVRKNGAGYERRDLLPLDRLDIPAFTSRARMSEAARLAAAKAYVRNQANGDVLLEVSGETYTIDDGGAWSLSTMETNPQPQGDPTVNVVMNRRFGALRLVATHLPHGEHILDAAFEVHEDKLCIPRQLAALTGIPMEDLCANFDSLCPDGWREEGVSLAELLEWCKQHERPFYYLHKGRLEVHLQDAPNPGIAFTTFDGHVYMYSQARAG